MNMMRMGLVGLVAFALLAGCNDPSKDKSKATVGEATTASATQADTKAPGATFAIAPATSKIEWTGSKVTDHHDGSFGAFTGSITAPDGAPEKGSVTIDIDTTSLKADPQKLQDHLKGPDFFDVAKYPKATFVSTGIAKGGDKGASHTITGNLTLHGVTKSISFPATVKPAGNELDADAEFVINRKDFGIAFAGMTNDLIKDNVVIKLTIRAPKKG